MKNLLKKFSRNKWLFGLAALVLVLSVLLLPQTVLAINIDIADYIASGLGHLALGIINLLGTLVLLPLINFVVWILSYNNFLDNKAVEVGWPLVRDLSNMFFVVILLFIAFGTILNIQSYHYKSTFFKLILMAVLVNFSKTIMGLAIDFAQVIMLTFVSAFRDAAAVNLIHAFGIRDMLKLDLAQDTFNNWEVVGVALLGVILLVVAVGLMLAYAAVLLWRIISLWVLVILSPVAFLMSAFPSGQKYASEIWSKFTEQLTTGVILAFFMWLSFTILAAGYSVESQGPMAESLLSGQGSGAAGTAQQRSSVYGSAAITEDVQWARLYTFIIAVALLLLALQYAQKAGGFAGSFAGKVSGKLSSMGTTAAKFVGAPAIGAYKLAGWGIKSLPSKVDQLLIKAQKRMGFKKTVSLRPTVWKAAVARYSKERETQWYTGVTEGMTDKMLRMFTGRRSKYAEFAYDARTEEKMREVSAAGELQEQLRSYLKKDHLESYQGKDKYGGDVTKWRVKRGHENETEAILRILTKNHDLNELFKDKDIGAAYNNEYTAIGVRDMIKDLFEHQGEEEAARVAKDLSLIGFENKDAHLYGTGTVDVDRDASIFFREATRDAEGDADILRTSSDLAEGETEDQKLVYIKTTREKAMDPQATLEEKNKYQDLLDDNWSVNQGDLATAFILKVAGRAGLQNLTAQMLVPEAVRRYEEDGVDKNGKSHKKREIIVDEEGATQRSFLTSRLTRTGKGILKAKAFDMQKEYHHMKDETKKYGLEPALDAILQFVESKKTDDVEKDRILTLVRSVTPELNKDADTDLGKKLLNSKIIEIIKQKDFSNPLYKQIREHVIRRSQEARMAAHGDARHAEQDKFGNWRLGSYSVYDQYNYQLNGAPALTAEAEAPVSADAPAPTPARQNIKRRRSRLANDRQKLNNQKAKMAPESASKVEAHIAGQEKVLNQVEASQQFMEKIEELTKAINKLATEVGQPAQEERNNLLAQKDGLEKKASVSVVNNVVNNVTSAAPAFGQPNWFKNPRTRLMFLQMFKSQLNEVKSLDVKLHRVIMSELKKNFANLDEQFGNLTEDTATEGEMEQFIREYS